MPIDMMFFVIIILCIDIVNICVFIFLLTCFDLCFLQLLFFIIVAIIPGRYIESSSGGTPSQDTGKENLWCPE